MSEETRGATVPKNKKKKAKAAAPASEQTLAANGETDGGASTTKADALDPRDSKDERDAKSADERQNAVRLGYGTALAASVLGTGMAVTLGPAPAVMTVAGIGLLGAIGFFWASVRTLAGDAPLPEDFEELERNGSARLASPAEARKATILLQLKDLERERALGKLNDEDYAELRETYREQAKAAIAEVEAETAAKMSEAEQLAAEYLARKGVKDDYRQPAARPAAETRPAAAVKAAAKKCPVCGTENDSDARFCKACAHTLTAPDAAESIDAPKTEGDETTKDSAEKDEAS